MLTIKAIEAITEACNNSKSNIFLPMFSAFPAKGSKKAEMLLTLERGSMKTDMLSIACGLKKTTGNGYISQLSSLGFIKRKKGLCTLTELGRHRIAVMRLST